MGNREPDPGDEEPYVLEDGRLTSLLGGSEEGVLLENMGVVEPAYDTATDPLAVLNAAELGREGVLLDSRDVDTLRDNRRSQVLELGVLVCPRRSPPLRMVRSISATRLVLGSTLLCLFWLAVLLLLLLLVCVLPLSPSLT